MYTLPKDTNIYDIKVIKNIIDYNELNKSKYKRLYNYYIGEHEIKNRTKSGSNMLSNNKVVVNHAKYITDTNVSYLLGNPVDYQVNTKKKIEIEPLLDEYKKQTINDLDCELAKKISIYGKEFEYVYANEEAKPRSCLIDASNAVIIYDDTVEHNKIAGIIYTPVYKGDDKTNSNIEYYNCIICDKNNIAEYDTKNGSLNLKLDSKKEHSFGDVPLIEYLNNYEELGDFETVISLIDAYNILQSDRINDKEQLVASLLILKGVTIDSIDKQNIDKYRILSGLPVDAEAGYVTKTLNETEIEVLKKSIETDIHKISMTPNMSDVNFVGNSSGVAIRYKLLSFEQNIKNKERSMEKGLMERFKLYNNFLTVKASMQKIEIHEVDAVFKRNLPSNDLEVSQMIGYLTDYVDRETLISQLSFIKDASEIVTIKQEEDEEKEKFEEKQEELNELLYAEEENKKKEKLKENKI